MSDGTEQSPVPPPAPPTGYRIDAPPPNRAEFVGFWLRFSALFFDLILIGIIGYALAAAGLPEGIRIVVAFLYFSVGDGVVGQTVGKKAARIRVRATDEDRPIGWWRGALRWLGRIASGLCLFIGYLWSIWDADKQSWHDKIADSIVVSDR